MSLSVQQLRDDFKTHLAKWEQVNEKNFNPQILHDIEKWGEHTEIFIQEKIKHLENDFSGAPLQGEYKRSVAEGFVDLERLMRTHKTILDIAKNERLDVILNEIKEHYKEYIVPLLNIMSKLENDFIAITTKTITDKSKILFTLEQDLKTLKDEKGHIQKRFFDFGKKKKILEISKKIRYLELRKKIIKLTLHHDKLNLYYFSHNRPRELSEIKEKADKLRSAFLKIEGV